MVLLSRFLRLFFFLLYHPFAWSYDLVSWTVSLGRWRRWVESVIPFVRGNKVLELGHGPGHLQLALRRKGIQAIGLDASRQMGHVAKKNLSNNGYTQIELVRGLGQELPFPSRTFDTIVATFPTDYIFEEQTLSNTARVLKYGGQLIVLPVAWVTGSGLLDRFAAWVFRVTGQAPSHLNRKALEYMLEPFIRAGFQTQAMKLEVKSSLAFIIIAENKVKLSEKIT